MKYKVVLLIIIAISTIGFTVFDIFYEKKRRYRKFIYPSSYS